MQAIEMNFKKDIQTYIQSNFSHFGVEYNLTDDLNNDLLNLFTVQRKIIYPFPRKVEISKELQDKINNGFKYKSEINHIHKLLEKGKDINPHQSKNLFNHHVHDHLVYDWNIYHLHLSLDQANDDYFKNRTKEVLFVYIEKHQALFIDVQRHPPHDNFANKLLLEILDNNWEGKLHEATDVIDVTDNLDQKRRFRLRKSGVNEGLLKVNNKIVAPPALGKASSGHSIEESMKLNQFNRWLKTNETAIKNNRKNLNKMFIKKHNLQSDPNYKLIIDENNPRIIDANTDTILVRFHETININ